MSKKIDKVAMALDAQKAIENMQPFPQKLERKVYLVANYLDPTGAYQFFYEEDGTYLFKRVIEAYSKEGYIT